MNYIIAMSFTLCIALAWVLVQHIARWYAMKHPEFGPAREEGGGCGSGNCSCKNSATCQRK